MPASANASLGGLTIVGEFDLRPTGTMETTFAASDSRFVAPYFIGAGATARRALSTRASYRRTP